MASRVTAGIDLTRPRGLPAARPDEEPHDRGTALPGLGTIFWSLLWSVVWGIVHLWVVQQIANEVGWERLPYNTVEEVGVWIFLAVDASAWLALSYAVWRFRRPILWFWWGACAAWWLILFLPYRASHAEFGALLEESEAAGLRLAERVEAYRRERDRLPGQLRDVALRDGRPIPVTAFDGNFEYRQQDVRHFELVISAGDKTFCYSSREPDAGFGQRFVPR